VNGPDGGHVLVDVGEFTVVPRGLLEDAVRRTLAAEERADVEISIALVGDEEIRDLNRRWLGKDEPTDVIAFALGDEGDVVGDVYLGVGQATRQAEELGIPLREELARLAIHGVLHVLGHDHPEGAERERSPMFELQERLLSELRAARPTTS
jgi:probable rRNA maturation factor